MILDEIVCHAMATVECHNILDGHCSDVLKSLPSVQVVCLSREGEYCALSLISLYISNYL